MPPVGDGRLDRPFCTNYHVVIQRSDSDEESHHHQTIVLIPKEHACDSSLRVGMTMFLLCAEITRRGESRFARKWNGLWDMPSVGAGASTARKRDVRGPSPTRHRVIQSLLAGEESHHHKTTTMSF